MTRLMLTLLAFALCAGVPMDASAKKPSRFRIDEVLPKKSAAEVLAAYDELYVAEVVSIYEDKKGTTVTLKTLHRYEGKVPKRTKLTPELGCYRWQERRMGEPLSSNSTRGRLDISVGKPYFVIRDGGECGVIPLRWGDSPVDLKTWRTQRDEQMTRAAAVAVAAHVAGMAPGLPAPLEATPPRTRCTRTSDFEQGEVAAADLVVAGRVVRLSGLRATLQIDSVYVERPEEFSVGDLPFERKSLTFDLLEPRTPTDLEGERVVVLAHTNSEGALEASGCEAGVRGYGDRPFPDALDGLVPISAEQLSCASLRAMSDDAAASGVVFHATVQTSRRITDTTQRVTLSGVHVYKGGELPETLTVKTGSPFTTSSFPLFKSGREVLVFGTFNAAGELEVDRCGATRHSPRPESFEVPLTREDIFRCAATTSEKKDMDAADVVGVGRLVRVDGSQSPPVAEFVMSSFYKGAERSREGRVLVQAPEDVASFAHDLDTLLFLAATPTAGVFALTSCGVQGLSDGLTPAMHGHEEVTYDPKLHKSSCAATPPRAPGAPGALALALLLGLTRARRRRGA